MSRPITPLERMAGTTGLEPATSAVTGQRSNQLNYVPREGNQRYSENPLFIGLLQLSHTAHCLLRKHAMAAITGKTATKLPPKPT